MLVTDDEKYAVIENTDIFYLVKEVNRRIQQGWSPIGGVATVYATGERPLTTHYLQAVIKIKD